MYNLPIKIFYVLSFLLFFGEGRSREGETCNLSCARREQLCWKYHLIAKTTCYIRIQPTLEINRQSWPVLDKVTYQWDMGFELSEGWRDGRAERIERREFELPGDSSRVPLETVPLRRGHSSRIRENLLSLTLQIKYMLLDINITFERVTTLSPHYFRNGHCHAYFINFINDILKD